MDISAFPERFRSFFESNEEQEEQRTLAESTAILDWMSQDYHKTFLAWLDSEMSKPFDVAVGHMDLIKSAVRANVFREIRRYLSRIEEQAQAAIQQARE